MSRQTLHRILLAVSLALAGVAAAGPAAAHAIVVDSAPGMNATLQPGTLALQVRFNVRIDRALSRLTLIGPQGAETPVALAADSAPELLAGTAPAPAPGKYRLRWQVLAADGHITRGDIPFQVLAPVPGPGE